MRKIQKKIRPFLKELNRLPKKSQLGVVGILFLTFVFGFFISVFYWRAQTPKPRVSALPKISLPLKPKKKVSFTLNPQKQTVTAGETFVVSVNLDSKKERLDAVDVVLEFDPQVLKVSQVSEGTFFSLYPVMKVEEGRVVLAGTIGFGAEQKEGVSGQGLFAKITLTPLANGQSSLAFSKEKTLAVYQGESLPVDTKDGTYIIE